ncbi:ABC transporter transmembrane region 2 [Carpediemonas membranifera]|uniref:ABC transporter transmembrane region 2 n=1 Tax=Carpediemonas membranifera TaxID=201153 RepID=A0A8J6BEB2_9EUKA|nr:ABC transporter transmembrane region 2 [Carpediemonas membranifera]|eukprot:KAG9395682.1 ABC transporter transmembrane region 2 [Carpediemonas membranifera]
MQPLLDFPNEVSVGDPQKAKDDALSAFNTESLDASSFEESRQAERDMTLLRTLAASWFIIRHGLSPLAILLAFLSLVSIAGNIFGNIMRNHAFTDLSCICFGTCQQPHHWSYYLARLLAWDVVNMVTSLSTFSWLCGREVRARLTRHSVKQFYHKGVPYRVLSSNRRIDNVDQRIAADIKSLSALLFGSPHLGVVGLLTEKNGLVSSIAQAVGFGYVIMQAEGLPILLIVLVYFAVTSVFAVVITLPLSRLTYMQEKLEGDLRRVHSRVREFAESIAFFTPSPAREKDLANASLKAAVHNQSRLVRWGLPFVLFKQLQSFLSSMLPIIILFAKMALTNWKCLTYSEIQFFQDTLPLLLVALSSLQGLLEPVATLRGLMGRVHTMGTTSYVARRDVRALKPSTGTADALRMSGVTVCTPTGRTLISGLDLEVTQGNSIVVMGPSGSGKSSLLRVIAGLWPPTSGSIEKPASTFFLPQRPYLPVGTLLDQLTYPEKGKGKDAKERAAMALQLCELGHLLEDHQLEDTEPWADMLSGGEQQRLGFARLFFHNPRWAVMDEATSALDGPLETRLLTECTRRGITMVSVAHRPSVAEHHKLVLELDQSGSVVRLEPVSERFARDPIPEPPIREIIRESTQPAGPLPPLKSSLSWPNVAGLLLALLPPLFSLDTLLVAVMPLFYLGRSTIAVFGTSLAAHSAAMMACADKQTYASPGTSLAFAKSMGSSVVNGVSVAAQMIALLVLGYRTRGRLTAHFHGKYFSSSVFYNVQRSISDADQRITADTANMADAVFGSLAPPVTAIVDNAMMPGLLVTFAFVALRDELWITVIPALCAVAMIGVLIISSIPSGAATRRLEKAEGELRYQLAHTIEHAESIAFHSGESRERLLAIHRLERVLRRELHLILAGTVSQFGALFGKKELGHMGGLAPVPVLKYLNYSFEEIYAITLFTEFIGKSSPGMILDLVQRLAPILGSFTRLAELSGNMSPTPPAVVEKSHPAGYQSIDDGEDKGRLVIEDATIATPSGLVLASDLNLVLTADKPLLIEGPSGSGKTSILRTLAGLWKPRSGRIVLPSDASFLPQTSYIFPGSLSEQVAYPAKVDMKDAEQTKTLIQALVDAGLGFLLDSHDIHSVAPWADMLSGGEQQRLGFARLFFHNPRWAVMDEATSALDGPLETRLLTECTRRGITMVSVAHRPSVAEHHKVALQLRRDHTFAIADIRPVEQ